MATHIQTGSIDLSTLNELHGDLTQYFWNEQGGSGTYPWGVGVHITLYPQDEFTDSTHANYLKGKNILLNTDGISIRNGVVPMMVLDNDSLDFNIITSLSQGTYVTAATFGQTSAQVGTLASGHVILDSNGLTIYNGILDLASFGTDARIGQLSATHTMINSGGMQVYAEDGVTLIANLGYGLGESQSGTDTAPYYTFGTREFGSSVGNYSMAIGKNITASGVASHAEGYNTTSSGRYSHAEGNRTTSSGFYSHAEGDLTRASGSASHAEGSDTTASGFLSHAEGGLTEASGYYSHAEGNGTIAFGDYSHVEGKYNVEDTNEKYAHIIGNGAENARSNAFAVGWDGNVYAQGNFYASCASDSSGTAYIGQVFNWQGNLQSNLTANAVSYVEGNGSITLKGGHVYLILAYVSMTNSTNGTVDRRAQIFNKTADTAVLTSVKFVASQTWGTVEVQTIYEANQDITLTVRGSASRPTTTIPTAWIRAVCIA